MKSATKHIVISTVLCALTLVVFLAFYNRLPESVPIHFDSAGVANSFWPRNVVVFGVPVACVLLNLISGFTRDEKSRTFSSNQKEVTFCGLLTEQTLDFVLHRLFCGLAEMDTDDIGCLADLLSDSRASGGVGCGIVHSKSSCK